MKTPGLLMPLLLLACNNLSVKEVAAQADAALKIEPGLWLTDEKIIWVNFPNKRSRPLAEEMKNSQRPAVSHCVTPAESEKSFPEKFAGDDDSSGNAMFECLYDNFQMANGTMNATKTCFPPGGGRIRTELHGTYSPTAYDMTIFIVSSADNRSIKWQMKGARTGACKA